MKVLNRWDSPQEDHLSFTFEGTFDPESALEQEVEPFLQALETCAGGWTPDVVKGKRSRKYSRAAFWKALEEGRDESSMTIGFYRTEPPALEMTLRLWFPPLPIRVHIGISVKPLSFFSKADCCRSFVDMVRAWACTYPVIYSSASTLAEDQLSDAPSFGREFQTSIRDGFDKIYEVSWLNVFGPELVESVGRERMLSTPAHRVEALPNGSVLLVPWPIAADVTTEEARLAQARAFVHLRPDLDFDTVLRTLRERSATLAPVEPSFHPDVAPLLTRVVDDVSISERQRKIAELNAWQPPEPEEWMPANAALPPDSEHPERILERYSLMAEHLVAMLHTDVPSIFTQTPESLTDADFYLWHEEYPRTRPREVLDQYVIPAVGAYLGEVLVRHLGGKWIPRKKLGEAQVLVGDRVWLPMVRAHRALRYRQSLLDYSLTQFYREAERHRSPHRGGID